MRDFLQEMAWRFILDECIDSLPVYPTRIINRHGWKLYTYPEFANKVHKSVSALIEEFDKEGFVFWSNSEQNFVICYNPDFPPDVIRWTLMHEIGHIVLNHVTVSVPALSRVRTEQRSLFEVEAQGFARRVLCPSIVLHACRALEPAQIMRLCGISREAAGYRSEYIKALEVRNKFRAHPLEREVEQQFRLFILRFLVHESRYQCEFAEEFYIDISA